MKKIIIGNWKMQLDFRGSMKLARELAVGLKLEDLESRDAVLCPSASSLLLVAEVIKETPLALGCQDIFWENEGAFTGCESPRFLHEAGCRYAIIGHSERRQYLREDDAMVHKKAKAALESGLIPILCVGETYEERRQGRTDHVILQQAIRALSGIQLIPYEQIIIAYEPVWAIGTGQPVEPSDARHAFRLIYQVLIDLWPLTIVQNNARIIYGGSVDGQNAGDFAGLDHFSGFLVGGASLETEEFIKIVKNC